MNSEEEFFDAETGEPACSSTYRALPRLRNLNLLSRTPVTHRSSDPPLLLPTGLESDDSGEVSFKDALVFDSKKVTGGGGSTQENGVWERR